MNNFNGIKSFITGNILVIQKEISLAIKEIVKFMSPIHFKRMIVKYAFIILNGKKISFNYFFEINLFS